MDRSWNVLTVPEVYLGWKYLLGCEIWLQNVLYYAYGGSGSFLSRVDNRWGEKSVQPQFILVENVSGESRDWNAMDIMQKCFPITHTIMQKVCLLSGDIFTVRYSLLLNSCSYVMIRGGHPQMRWGGDEKTHCSLTICYLFSSIKFGLLQFLP